MELAITIANEIDFCQKKIPMDRGCLSITTKVLATQEDTTVLKLHITNTVASNDINKKLMEP